MKTHGKHIITPILTILLQIIIVSIGVIVLAALLIEPQLEGRNANASLFQTYFTDPFLAYVYLAAVPFFVALYQAFKGLKYARESNIAAVVRALRMIRNCALIIAGSTIVAGIYLRIATQSNHDDSAGAIMLGAGITVVSFVVAAATTVFAKRLYKTPQT